MADLYGQYLSRCNRIELQPELTDIDEANTFIHEMLHAIVWTSSLNQKGQALELSKDEEVVVNVITNNLTQIFMDNDWVLKYLTQKLKQ
jgi:hypothetical protein